MSQLIVFLLGLVAGAVVAWVYMRREAAGGVINPEQVKVRKENLEKVMEMARQKGELANDDVEKALGVSDATAQRYLQELESQGLLVQIGTRGKYVRYAVS